MMEFLFGSFQDFDVEVLCPAFLCIDPLLYTIFHRVCESDVRHGVSLLLWQLEHVLYYSNVVCHDWVLHLCISVPCFFFIV